LATRILADFGAEVIKVESGLYDNDRGGRAGTFSEFNRNKLSITVDLNNPEGKDLIKKLVAKSDVVMDNFRPGTLERFGLAYDTLKEINPQIISASMPGYGSTGPARDHASYGSQLMANAGVLYLWGHASTPVALRGRSAFPDFVAGAQAALAVVAALHARDTTGEGQQVEVAQAEAVFAGLGVGLLDSLVNGRNWQPSGNRSLAAAPHDAYRCIGGDSYCVIACATEDEWTALCQAMKRPELSSDARFARLSDRLANADKLDGIVEKWTAPLTPRQVMHTLQRAGVPSAAVQTGEDVYYDPQPQARGFVVPIDDEAVGAIDIAGLPVHLSRTPGTIDPKGRPPLRRRQRLRVRRAAGTWCR
jgi:crotonobetainyl-CoA:carnitine CoA-transferase CaiB-like acyl-CoA transferase